jgi:hypothetical protein
MNENSEKSERNRPDNWFKPGQSGNPNGRPKGKGLSLTTLIKRKLEEIPEGKQKTHAEYLIDSILKKAIIDGDTQMQKTVWNYIDGMPRQETDNKTQHSGEITTIYQWKEPSQSITAQESGQENSTTQASDGTLSSATEEAGKQ